VTDDGDDAVYRALVEAAPKRRGTKMRIWEEISSVLVTLIVAAGVVLVILLITLVVRYNVSQQHQLAHDCVEHGGQWINGMCVRGTT
jgi:hypothetical protein